MRTLPIGNTKEKMISRFAKGDSDGMFDVWTNAMGWHRFLDKCGLITHPEQHQITIFTMYADSPWKTATCLYIGYNWLNEEFEIYTIPECEFEGELPEAQHVNPWELPGQRFLENFTGLTDNADQTSLLSTTSEEKAC